MLNYNSGSGSDLSGVRFQGAHKHLSKSWNTHLWYAPSGIVISTSVSRAEAKLFMHGRTLRQAHVAQTMLLARIVAAAITDMPEDMQAACLLPAACMLESKILQSRHLSQVIKAAECLQCRVCAMLEQVFKYFQERCMAMMGHTRTSMQRRATPFAVLLVDLCSSLLNEIPDTFKLHKQCVSETKSNEKICGTIFGPA